MPREAVVRVAVEQSQYHFDKPYSYRWPSHLPPAVRGCRVMVPFGAGNRQRQGIVLETDASQDSAGMKTVTALLDEEPLLDDRMLSLALWLKERVFCTVFDVVRAALPTGLYWRIQPTYRVARVPAAGDQLSEEETRLLTLIRRAKTPPTREKLYHAMGLDSEAPVLERLCDQGWVIREDDALRRTGDATIRMVRPTLEGEEAEKVLSGAKLTEKQRTVLKMLTEVGSASVKEIGYFCSVTSAVLAALEKKGLVTFFEAERLRSETGTAALPPLCPTPLSPQQKAAFDGLLSLYRTQKAAGALLYGVTGSGKTQVYMNLIDEVLADGRGVIVLVPEISLTPQMLELFSRRYGRRVAVLHSALSIGERMDEWKRIKRGDAMVVLGTRSAVFAPCKNLGLILLDEEQEHTYKSENAPRYHARDVAAYRCGQYGALLLLCSATPSVETAYAAKTGRYALFSLTERYGETRLPQVDVVDMREYEALRCSISPPLEQALRDCLDEGKQAILLMNRRGYNTFISCRSCGHVLSCPQCSISLTYHQANHRLMCHYCGYTRELATVCPHCGSDKVRYSGIGTQRIEQEIGELFPNAPVLRMDTDTTMSRFAFREKFARFARGEYAIMIGTQMVAKGLDFPNVGLVGVLSADQSLYGDSFRCFESAFSLLTQVIGRAGRRKDTGRAVIQTFTPENAVIALAARQDYWRFFSMEIATRKMMKYPPFSDLYLFGFVGRDERRVREAAFAFLQLLRRAVEEDFADLPVIALDPTPAMVFRVAGKYRYKLLIKSVHSSRLREMIGQTVRQYYQLPLSGKVSVLVDRNPVNLL